MTMMQAIAIGAPGGPEMLQKVERPLPTPAPGEVLIRVGAAGVNRLDVLQRRGLYPPPPGASDLPGLEIAGEIAALGKGATRWKLGDRVCALTTGGGYAEFCAAHESHCLPLPDGFSLTQAAAIPETHFTVWHNVFQRGRLQRGETLLVHGGTSGIGTTAIQLGKAFGAMVIATAGTDEKCDACRRLGAAHAINYRSEDFVTAIKAITGGRGADVVLDMVAGSYLERNIRAAAVDGRIVQIAFLGGSKATLDVMPLMLKRLTLTGSTLRARSVAFKAALAEDLHRSVWPLLEAGAVAPVIDSTFPLADAGKAHRRMEDRTHVGKIMLAVD